MQHYRTFIFRALAFVGLVVGVVFVMWHIVVATRHKLCYHPDKTTLVFGNSRIQYGYDDSVMSGTWNVGLNADNYNLIYWKLKLLHKYNKQLQNVILEVDQTLLFNYIEGVEYKLHPYYWDVMNAADWIRLLERDKTILMYPFDWVKIIMPIKSIFTTVSFKDLGLGGYTRLDRDKLGESLAMERSQKIIRKHNIDALQQEYLNKIIQYCQQNNIDIEFISMPSYRTTNIEIGHRQANQYIKTHFPNMKYYDYELVEFADSCYGDIVHLNYKGACVLAKKMKADYGIK